MNEDNLENTTPENSEEEVTSENTNEEETTLEDDIEELRKQAKLAENYKVRAEKAEKQLKTSKKETPKEETPKESRTGLSDEDLIYIARTDIHDEDLPEVREYAEWKGISVKEAHQKMKPILDTRVEERRTAEATNTKSPRGTSKPDGSRILADASRGKLPSETDAESMDALVNAHLASKTPSHTRK